MQALSRFSLILLTLAPAVASAQSSPAATASPALLTRADDLPQAPEPQQTRGGDKKSPQNSSQPSLEDLGITPDQVRADRDAQRRLDLRSHDLKVHQALGLVTLIPIAAACLTSALAPPDLKRSDNETGRDIHVALGSASVALYGATAWYAIKAPRMQGQGPTKGGIKLHKYLVAIHAPGMVLTPILGAMAYNQAANGQKVTGIASAHGAVALVTAGAYAASIIAVSWPLRLPGHHAKLQTQAVNSATTGEAQ